MFTVDNKFEIGQEVYIIEENVKCVRNEIKCPTCDGVGKIVYKGCELRCPNCNNGVTTISIDRVSLFSIANRGKITSIRFKYVNNDSFSLRYKICGKYIPENRLALTEDEAVKICEELNTLKRED